MAYKAPVRDLTFILNEVLEIDRYTNQPGFQDVSSELAQQILEEAARVSDEVIAPINNPGDKEGCHWAEGGVVTTPKGWKEAYHQMVEAGWTSLSFGTEYGGQGLPAIVSMAVGQFTAAASAAFSMYPGLTAGAYHGIEASASDELKQIYLPKMATGEWTGTMNLTEPQCGTDLGMVRTKAVPNGDGSYSITGQKIWISAGEHDFADNIIHTVLARVEGAVPGIKGLSLFVVPKFLVNEDGSIGERNGVQCAGLEHKMGIHGNATCVMAYENAKGWLIGEEGRGMNNMFVVMNEARLGTGLQGLAIGDAAYQAAVEFANDRLQGRALTGAKNPDGPADPIMVHPDVRRMLMDAKAFTEGMRALYLYGALQVDLAHKAETEEERTRADDLLGLLTPVIKGYGTDKGFAVATDMQQVFGGHGYIAEWGMEQFVRDARIAMIYEGTNGVQAMDLCGRKLATKGGAAIQAFFKLVDDEAAAAEGDLAPLGQALAKAVGEQKAATMWFMQNAMANPNNLGAGAHHYMTIMGIVSLGWMWLKMARVAAVRIAAGEDTPFYRAKLTTARYFFERYGPDCGALRRKLEAGSDAMMALDEDAFLTAA
jgi:alkylation response protein AidB-like acyl-CoA dehydrogenase